MTKEEIVAILKRGGVGVLATDTIYGLVGQALNPKTVERIYAVRKRNPEKPSIILISSIEDLQKFDIVPDQETLESLEKYWSEKRPTSIIISLSPTTNTKKDHSKFKYLHRGTHGLAFRLPKNKNLIEILKQTGPLIAPSANPEGLPPAATIKQAKAYFGASVDFYIAGRSNKKPSKLIKIENGKVEVLRK